MEVKIKEFNVEMEVKTRGIEFEVRDPSGEEHLGDLILTSTRLIWCNRRVQRRNGVRLEWREFIEMMNNLQ